MTTDMENSIMMYELIGDYGLSTERLIRKFGSLRDALLFVDDYASGGDLNGFSILEVVRFADDGEAIFEWTLRASDTRYFDFL